ncbi:MAG: ABC transporter ATP-binding protein [Deltaproteobacteria bacterium]|nr:ABC transporter ATP-binding protein [Candidatus Tharpellaceae bacterium]
MSLEIRNLSYAVDQFQFSEINLTISDETYFILLGPTGSGKSSLLKCILGINQIKTGEIFIDGKSIANLTVEKRNIGYLPQNCALFPHLDVQENINFGMRIRNYPETEIKERTGQLLSLFNIEHLANRSTRNLSGGEKQKVSLARALATRPALLLLDEPFSAVDEGTKKRLWFELKKVFKTVKVPVIHVTHNFEEAYSMAEQIGIMVDGSLRQIADAQTLFERPATKEVAWFLNYRNFFSGEVKEENAGIYTINSHGINIVFTSKTELSGKISLCIRPQDIKIINPAYPVKAELADNVYEGIIRDMILYPESAIVFVKVDGSSSDDYDFELKFPLYILSRHNLYEQKRIKIALWQPNIIVFEN